MPWMWISALVALVLDQASKHTVVFSMELIRQREITVWPPFVTFRYGENTGINFGLFGGGSDEARWVLVGLSVVVCTALLWWVTRTARPWQMYLATGLLIGGALGNVVDRVRYGYVLDFLNMSCCGIDNPYVFNLADVFIFAGAIGLFLFEGRGGDGSKNAG
ncbi:MAG: signal peptidase II [Pseudomonadota bacterium]